MNLTEQILEIMIPMQIAFSQARSFKKFIEVIFAILCTAGRHTITSFIFFLQGEHKDWTHMYRFFSKQKWDPDICFDVLAESALRKVLQKHNDIVIALDDFRVEKTGKTIPHTRYQLDPKSPSFHPNLMWGHRYAHATLLIARKKKGKWQAARSITVRIKLAPHVRKPGKKATEKDWEAYEASKKDHNLCQYAADIIRELRQLFDRLGYERKTIKLVADGGYCNKTIFGNLPDRVDLITRCRKDAKLCHRSSQKRKFYDDVKFTPHDLYKDEAVGSRKLEIFYGRKRTWLKYKEWPLVYWERGAKKRPLKAMVVYGVRYRRNRNGYTNYREPMYLLTTDLTLKTQTLIQYYLFRWEIEVAHRQLKNDLGISQAQVWNERSVERCPKLIALANSIIHLAEILLKDEDDRAYQSKPNWDKGRHRISLEYLRRRLRQEIADNPALSPFFSCEMSWQSIFTRVAA